MSVFNSTSSRSCTLPDDSSVAIGRISSVKTAIESPFKALSKVFWRKIHTTKRWTVNGKQTRTTRLNAFITRPCNRPPFKRRYLAFYSSDFIHSKTIVPTTQRSIKSLLDLIQHDERLSRKNVETAPSPTNSIFVNLRSAFTLPSVRRKSRCVPCYDHRRLIPIWWMQTFHKRAVRSEKLLSLFSSLKTFTWHHSPAPTDIRWRGTTSQPETKFERNVLLFLVSRCLPMAQRLASFTTFSLSKENGSKWLPEYSMTTFWHCFHFVYYFDEYVKC